MAVMMGGSPAPVAPVAKTIVTDPLAALIAKIAASNGAQGAFDPALAAAISAAQTGESDLNRQFDTGTQEAKIGYGDAAQQLEQQKINNYQTNEGNFAGNGLLRSGIFATQQGKVGTAYQQGLTAAAERRQQTIQDLTNQRLSGYNTIEGSLNGAQASAAERAQAQAQADAIAKIQQQQADATLAIQQQGIANQQSIAQQQLALYQQGLGPLGSTGGGASGGTGQSTSAPINIAALQAYAQAVKAEAIKRKMGSAF